MQLPFVCRLLLLAVLKQAYFVRMKNTIDVSAYSIIRVDNGVCSNSNSDLMK